MVFPLTSGPLIIQRSVSWAFKLLELVGWSHTGYHSNLFPVELMSMCSRGMHLASVMKGSIRSLNIWEKLLVFNSVLICRQQRLFPVSTKCGAMAIHFLHGALHGTMLPIVASDVDMVHSMLRKRFQAGLGQNGTALRPWIWGNGDVDDDEQDCPPASSGECGLLPRMPSTRNCAVIESLTRETRTRPSAEVSYQPGPSAFGVGDVHFSTVNSLEEHSPTVPVGSALMPVSELIQFDCQRMRGFGTPQSLIVLPNLVS